MKTLEELGNLVKVHDTDGNIDTRKTCACGRVHILKRHETTRFLDCRCGRRILLV